MKGMLDYTINKLGIIITDLRHISEQIEEVEKWRKEFLKLKMRSADKVEDLENIHGVRIKNKIIEKMNNLIMKLTEEEFEEDVEELNEEVRMHHVVNGVTNGGVCPDGKEYKRRQTDSIE